MNTEEFENEEMEMKDENINFVPGTDIPKPEVELVGQSGNAFYIIGATQEQLRRSNVPKDIIDKFVAEATSGDYDNVIRTAMKYADVI
jgi:peptidase E